MSGIDAACGVSRRRGQPSTTRTAATVITMAWLALLAAACSGGSSSSGASGATNAGGSQSSHLLAFAGCMRSHGVPKFPDPASDDKFPGARQVGVSDSQYQAALDNCRHLLPNGGSGPDQAELQQEVVAMLPFARCMRSHGVPNWPDPAIYTNPAGNTGVVFNVVGRQGLDRGGVDSPRVHTMEQRCQHLLPSSFDHFRFVSN